MKISNENAIYKSVLFAILFLAILETGLYIYSSFRNESRLNDLYPEAEVIESQIETMFQSTLTISDGYLSFIETHIDSSREESESFLDHLFSYDEVYVKNIALLEDTTIKYNYPYEENQSSIGVDLATIDTQRDDVLNVKNNLEPMYIGPVELVQGGQAFILRLPVLDGDTYYGQISVVIDADLFYQLVTEEVSDDNISFTITDDQSGAIIFQAGDFNSNRSSVTTNYTDQYLSWTVSVQEANNNSNFIFNILMRVVGYGIIFVLCYLIYIDQIKGNEILFNSEHDTLTGDFNRAKFISDYKSGLFTGMLIAFTDINKFKLLNDTLGHSFGDWCLMQVSKHFNIHENLRTYRISGDEFILVSKAPMSIEEFRTSFPTNNLTFYSEEFKQKIDIDISIGLLERLSDSIELESILMYLDYAMYDAKNEGKPVTIVDQELMSNYDKIKVIEQQLIEDIKANRLIPYYQPIINVDNGTIEGFEVLSRWYYQGEVRSAAMFITTVKKIKYVDLVDANLFRKLQDEYQSLSMEIENLEDYSFSINLSAETLMIFERNNEQFDELVKNCIIPKDKVIFEISEDMNLGLISIETLRYIQEQGYSIVVDDFGAGVSKLSDVLSGELKMIKTDKSLLPMKNEELASKSAFKTLITAITATNTTICVEGIETVEQLEISKKSGCSLAQGYLFSKPIPKEEVADFIKNFDFKNYVK